MNKRRKKKMRAAGKAPSWVRHIAASKSMKKPKLRFSRGAASEVRIIMENGRILT
jgi:hypothetical protein